MPDPLHPRAGDLLVRQWDADGISHTLAVAALRPHPYQRFRASGFAKYQAWRTRTRQMLEIACKSAHVTPYASGRLGVCVGAGARRSAPLDARRTQNGDVDHRTESSIMDFDADNLIKAILDASNGILFKDDKMIRAIGPSAFTDDQADWFSLAIWSAGTGGLILCPPADWGEGVIGPTRGDWLQAERVRV